MKNNQTIFIPVAYFSKHY